MEKAKKPLILLALILIFFTVFLAISNFKINQKKTELDSELQSLENKAKELEQKKNLLESQISQSQNQEYLEEVAREQLNLQKEGEKVVAFPISENQEETKETKPEKQTFWQKIKIFFGIK